MTETAYETTFGKMLRGTAMEWAAEGHEPPQLILTGPPWCRAHQKFVDYLDWQEQQFEALVACVPPTSSLVVIHGQEWNPPYQSGRVFQAMSALQMVIPICQQFVLALDEASISNSVLEQVVSLCAEKLRAWPQHLHAWWYGVMPTTWKMFDSSVIGVPTSPADREWRRAAAAEGLLHRAAWPVEVAAAFVEALTQPGDLVVDPFAGSNAVGYACEHLERRWLAVEQDENSIKGSMLRFDAVQL